MAPTGDDKAMPYLAVGIGAYMLWGAYRALVVPGGEFAMPPAHYIEMLLDLALTLILVVYIARQFNKPLGGVRTLAVVLAGLGVLAGLVQLGVRFTSDHGWWTGHYMRHAF